MKEYECGSGDYDETQSKWLNFLPFQRSLRNEAVYRNNYKIFLAVLTTSSFRPHALGD